MRRVRLSSRPCERQRSVNASPRIRNPSTGRRTGPRAAFAQSTCRYPATPHGDELVLALKRFDEESRDITDS